VKFLVTVVHRLELAAVDGHARTVKEIEATAQQNSGLARDFFTRAAVVGAAMCSAC
jgi:hypothetical protein